MPILASSSSTPRLFSFWSFLYLKELIIVKRQVISIKVFLEYAVVGGMREENHRHMLLKLECLRLAI